MEIRIGHQQKIEGLRYITGPDTYYGGVELQNLLKTLTFLELLEGDDVLEIRIKSC
jgi:hypothetical protein